MFAGRTKPSNRDRLSERQKACRIDRRECNSTLGEEEQEEEELEEGEEEGAEMEMVNNAGSLQNVHHHHFTTQDAGREAALSFLLPIKFAYRCLPAS